MQHSLATRVEEATGPQLSDREQRAQGLCLLWQAHVQLSSCPVSAPSCTSSSDSGLALIPKCPCLSSTLCQKWPGPPARTGTADTGGVHSMSEHCGYTGGEPRRPAGASLVPAHLHLAARLTRSRVVRQEVAPQAGLSIPCLGGSAPQLAPRLGLACCCQRKPDQRGAFFTYWPDAKCFGEPGSRWPAAAEAWSWRGQSSTPSGSGWIRYGRDSWRWGHSGGQSLLVQ